MEQKFQLLKVRPFGDVINDSMAFGQRYIRQFGYVILVLVVPVYVIGSWLYSNSLAQAFNFGQAANLLNLKRFGAASVLGFMFIMLGQMILTGVFISTFLAAEESQDGQLEASDIFSKLREHMGRLISFYVIAILLCAVIIGLAVGLIAILGSASATGLIVLLCIIMFVGAIYLGVSFTFASIVYVREGLGFSESLSRSFYLIKDNFWWTLLVLFIAGFVGSMVAYIFQVPNLVLTFMKAFTTARTGHIGYEVTIIDRLALMLANFGGIVTATIISIVTFIQYYSLVEKKDGVSLMQQIDNIGANENHLN